MASTAVQRGYDRDRQRRYRERKRAAEAMADIASLPEPDDPVGALVEWSRSCLVVPPGHPNAGSPMVLPDFAIDFLRKSWDAPEAALSMARKGGKTSCLAVLCLGFLAGVLARPGFRGAAVSISKEKAAELRRQVVEIAEASSLTGLKVRASPYPGGTITGPYGGTLELLAADSKAGHSAGFDLVVVDETGLLEERSRELLAGLRSSVSAREGRLIHISVRGRGVLFAEVLANPAVCSVVYEAPADCKLDDPDAWRAANPSLGVIKSEKYMRDQVRRLAAAPMDESAFRSWDLNQQIDPHLQMVCSVSDLKACFVKELPARSGGAYVGFDFGTSSSGTAAFVIWPATGRCESWLAFGDNPSLADRGRRDNAPYEAMQRRGELHTYPGRIVPVAAFLERLADDLKGVHVAEAAADGYKDAEVKDGLEAAFLRWPVQFRRVGAGKDGSRDVREFQRLILQRKLKMRESLSLADAVRNSTLRFDDNGNPALNRARSRGRIDLLSAGIIAGGLAARHFDRPVRPFRMYSI